MKRLDAMQPGSAPSPEARARRTLLRSWIPADGSEAALLGFVVLIALLLIAIFARGP